MIFIKIAIFLFLILWIGLGGLMIVKAEALFGQDKEQDYDSAGARSLSVAHLSVMWLGGFILGVYFLLK